MQSSATLHCMDSRYGLSRKKKWWYTDCWISLSLINGFTPAQTCTEETELTAHGTSLLVQEHHFHHPKAWAYYSKLNSTECHDTSNFSHREQPTTGEIGVQLLATHIMACCAGAVIIPIPLSGNRDSILIETWLYTILSKSLLTICPLQESMGEESFWSPAWC